MDIKAQVTKAVESITKDTALQEQFKTDPVKAVKSVLGVDLPEDAVNQVVTAVKAKLSGNKLGSFLKGFQK